MMDTNPFTAHMRYTPRLLRWLFVLRVPIYLAAAMLTAALPFLTGLGYATYLVATNVLIALLIWHEREHLAQFHIDRLAIGLFFILKPIEFGLVLAGLEARPAVALPLYGVYLVVAGLLGWGLYTRRATVPAAPRSLRVWLPVGLGLGILVGLSGGVNLLLSLPEGYQASAQPSPLTLGRAAILAHAAVNTVGVLVVDYQLLSRLL